MPFGYKEVPSFHTEDGRTGRIDYDPLGAVIGRIRGIQREAWDYSVDAGNAVYDAAVLCIDIYNTTYNPDAVRELGTLGTTKR